MNTRSPNIVTRAALYLGVSKARQAEHCLLT